MRFNRTFDGQANAAGFATDELASATTPEFLENGPEPLMSDAPVFIVHDAEAGALGPKRIRMQPRDIQP